MKICAVICEYNPFHSGHLYQLTKIRSTCDRIVCVMSGNFVQRAEPAIIDKYTRTKIALSCGADMVIENPIVYAVANGEKFADGAVKAIRSLPGVTHIAMGCETSETEFLKDIAAIQLEESSEFKLLLDQNLDQGMSYATAFCNTTVSIMEQKKYNVQIIKDILSKPNNLLCIEYLKSITRHGLNITPILIKRKGNDYSSISPYGDYLSATAIRELIAGGRLDQASPYLPNSELYHEAIKNKKIADYNLYGKISAYNLRCATAEDLSKLYDCKEGIEHKLKENASAFWELDDILSNTKSKRYTYARLKRIVLQHNLAITKQIMDKLAGETIPPRLLGIKTEFKHYLSEAGANLIIRNSDYARYSNIMDYFEIEKKASSLYSLLTCNKDGYYTDQFICRDIYD